MSSSSEVDTGMVLALADDALVASHRLSEWIARAPSIEEDVALANIALDLLGQARLLYALIGDEDELAYRRPAGAFRNAVMLERPNGDFGATIARLLLLAAHQHALYSSLAAADGDLGAIAAKAVKEVSYHRDHARAWTVRLGDGTEESHRRMQDGLDAEWAVWGELAPTQEAVDWATAVITQATLRVPGPVLAVERQEHTADLDELLSTMREVTAVHPGATW
ncbi:1,2-phenylacetyl-CoA epoxidase subunit PaaC [Nocardioides marmorisolisilvae]|uniref:Phenylacetate-CoA oxygenase subunit PaaI n=1 Tax=Nocardioides marmorisolisilvae TaxID=1542737 RepID=A0A3N0DW05_9ACTN|nr:1,2-phenylacetyl-CoA epoxidase subunit PaaC [Nocardioides marmorisolisilvae]RNL79784.1 phenylacetate-CoA oxygenase subunit PaaI [Nocardioides marmorisolisilvae]